MPLGDRQVSIARHTVYNVVGALVPVAVSLVTVPFYLKVIGLDRYGLLAICWLLVGYFALFDFGLGRATAQKIATLAGAAPYERNQVFWTGASLSLVFALVAVAVFAPLASVGLGMMKLADEGLRQEVNVSLPLLVAAVPFGIAQSLLAGTLEGRAEFLRLNLTLSFGTIATAVLPLLAALWIDPRLPTLLGASLLARALVLLLLCLACVRAVPLTRPSIAEAAQIRSLLQFGGWTSVTNVVDPILVFVDRLAIGALLGAAAVAVYVVPFNLVSQLVLLPAALARALFPKMASVSTEEARAMSRESLLVLAFLITPATLLMLVGVGPFLKVWIGEAAKHSIPVAHVLLFGFWANSFARTLHARLQAGGRPDIIAKIHLAEVIPYLVLLYLFMTRFGIVGAALAWTIRCTADTLVLNLLDKVPRLTLNLLVIHGLVVLAAILIIFMATPGSLIQWSLLAATAALLAVILWRNVPPRVRQVVGNVGRWAAAR